VEHAGFKDTGRRRGDWPAIIKEAIVQTLSEGQCIKHEQYGFGIVAESDNERTTIDFDSVGLKKFVTTLMSMELVGEAPERPTKPRRRSKKAGATAAAKVAAASNS
jgi:hypothetical protein